AHRTSSAPRPRRYEDAATAAGAGILSIGNVNVWGGGRRPPARAPPGQRLGPIFGEGREVRKPVRARPARFALEFPRFWRKTGGRRVGRTRDRIGPPTLFRRRRGWNRARPRGDLPTQGPRARPPGSS